MPDSVIFYLPLGCWLVVLTLEFLFFNRKKRAADVDSSATSARQTQHSAVSINKDESILLGDELGEVRITFLSVSDDSRVRLGFIAPDTVKIFRKEKDSKELLNDKKHYQKELKYWRDEIIKQDRQRKNHENMVQPAVDRALLEEKNFAAISKKYNVSNDFIQKRYSVLEKAGSFDTPLFEVFGN